MCTEKWMICHLSRIKITKLPFTQNCSCLRRSIMGCVMKLLVICTVCPAIEEGMECKNRNSIIQLEIYPVRTAGLCQKQEKPECFANELDQDRQVNDEKYIVSPQMSFLRQNQSRWYSGNQEILVYKGHMLGLLYPHFLTSTRTGSRTIF